MGETLIVFFLHTWMVALTLALGYSGIKLLLDQRPGITKAKRRVN